MVILSVYQIDLYLSYSSNNLQCTFDALFQNYEVHKYCELGKRGSGSVIFLYASKKLDPKKPH